VDGTSSSGGDARPSGPSSPSEKSSLASPSDPYRHRASLLDAAVTAARIGGRVDHAAFGTHAGHAVTDKDSHTDWNPVTDVDTDAERAITDYLATQFPTHAFLGEENTAGQTRDAEHTWIVDPIDGTVNFIHGIPHYGVSVAYAHNGAVQVAACLDPERDELFTAIRGYGAWCNGAPIHASAATQLSEAVVCTGFYYDRGAMMERTLSTIGKLFGQKINGIRRTGSAVLDLCWTAAGRFDAFFEYELGAWDFAAAALIAAEAGATVTDSGGVPVSLGSTSIAVAATDALHAALIAQIR
jgi:myo-inositol-1(or 4)-monophosphatase